MPYVEFLSYGDGRRLAVYPATVTVVQEHDETRCFLMLASGETLFVTGSYDETITKLGWAA